MNDSLSQEEIDALMGKNNHRESEMEIELSDIDKDIIGEVSNISMSMAATTLSDILNKQVLITTPRVSVTPFKSIVEECAIPKVVTNIEFKHGLEGNNLLILDVKDASIIADIMMGGDGSGGNENLGELELSAMGEAMNQMIGSACTSMATMLKKPVDIFPPEVEVWDNKETINYEKISLDSFICKIAFDLTVEGLIESEIMQVYSIDTVADIIKIMTEDTMENIMEQEEIKEAVVEEVKDLEVEKEEIRERVSVEKPEFSELNPDRAQSTSTRNLDLIMDVPLDFSVVLGKSKKTIKEILSFGDGSVVELNKLADEPLEIYVNEKLIAEGEVVVINENFGIRITNILSKEERVRNLK